MTRGEFLMGGAVLAAPAEKPVTKIKDLVVYRDERFYSAFPSIVRLRNGELMAAFRRAPDRRKTGAPGVSHTDPNSYLVSVRSKDNGATWTKEPELIWAHAEGGSQDPCMIALRDGTILCASYWWYQMPLVKDAKAGKQPFEFMGGYIVRSHDGGRTWQGPILPPPVPGVERKDPFGRLLPAYNRGSMCQGRDGRVYWAVAHQNQWGGTSISLMISADGGTTWQYSCRIAEDEKVTFNETSLYETAKGDLVAFVRTANFDDHTVVVRSTDGGRSFRRWEDAGWQGHPHHAVRMNDGRVWLVYGYRHKPYGIRARVLNAECTDVKEAAEIVLRDDGGSGDLGYAWAVVLPGGQVLSTYYFNQDNGTRYIGGTLCG